MYQYQTKSDTILQVLQNSATLKLFDRLVRYLLLLLRLLIIIIDLYIYKSVFQTLRTGLGNTIWTAPSIFCGNQKIQEKPRKRGKGEKSQSIHPSGIFSSGFIH